MAKDGQMDAVKIMAKDLVRSKRYVKKFIMMKTQITAVSLKIQTLKSQDAMANAMKGVTKAMGRMKMQKIMMEFQKQSEMMDMKQEMMEDTMDDAMEGEDDEEESEKIVAQVLGELGLQLNEELGGIQMGAGPSSSQP